MKGGPIEYWFQDNFPDWKKESKFKKESIKKTFIKILLGGITYWDMRREIRDLFPKNVNKQKDVMKLRVKWSSSIDINRYKIALLSYDQRPKYFSKLGFYNNEKELKKFLNDSDLKIILKRSREKIIQPLSISKQEKIVQQVVTDLRKRLYSFSRRKLTFVVNHDYMEHDDIVSNLSCKVIENVRWYYPFRTYQHFINSSYQAAYNHGINMIKYYTANKRKVLMNDEEGGYYNRFSVLDEIPEKFNGIFNQYSTIENNILYEEIFSKLDSFDQKIASILLDVDSKEVDEFISWNKEKGSNIKSIDELIAKRSLEDSISDYMEINRFRVNCVKLFLEEYI